jgi:molybdenum cofactor biosynthesis protein B
MSDTRSEKEDKSGDLLATLIQDAGHVLADRKLVRDDEEAIRQTVEGWTNDPQIDCVITTGGTGFTGRDVTPEAVKPLFEKEIEGFAILFHMLSYQKVGTSTIQSRACAGVARGTYIFCLPGSPGACRDGWDGILKYQLDARHRPCNFVEIMPRLQEHRKTAG